MYKSQSHYDNATDDHLFIDNADMDRRTTELLSTENEKLASYLNNEEANGPDLCDSVEKLVQLSCKHFDLLPVSIKEVLEEAAKVVAGKDLTTKG